jgi:hypothetical protein
MELVFVCPQRRETFFSGHFEIIDNRGIAVDDDGKSYLNARIRLTVPCPYCGEHHEYQANELACPFS